MKRVASLLLGLLLVSSMALAARKHDPLTEAEVDQLRDAKQEPDKRLKLYIKFTDDRFDSMEQLRSDPKQAQGRGNKVHDMLQDLTSLFDEISSNLDDYGTQTLDKDQQKQFRKGTKEVVAASARWTDKLRVLRNAAQMDPQAKVESRDYEFALRDAEDALKSCADTAKDYAEEKDETKPKK